jgi:hypothetical protein
MKRLLRWLIVTTLIWRDTNQLLSASLNIIACRHVTGQQPRDKQATVFQTRVFSWQLNTATEEQCFLCGSCRDIISRTVGAMTECIRVETETLTNCRTVVESRHGQDSKQQTGTNIWGSTPRQTDWLTVSRNVTLTWMSESSYSCQPVRK